MTFLIDGSVRLTAAAADGSVIPAAVLSECSFLGLTALTRQSNLGGAHALEIDREHLEHLVMRKPLLLHDLGRIIEERQGELSRAGHRERVGNAGR
jgi:hypothetical protein